MSLYKKDTLPRYQVRKAWKHGKDAVPENLSALEILQAGKEAADALFLTTHRHRRDGSDTSDVISDRQDIERRLYTVFANTVTSFRLRAWHLTHDATGQPTDLRAWEKYVRLADTFLPPGGRSRIARSGELLIDQCRSFCLAASDFLPGSEDLLAPMEELLAEYEAGLDKVDAIKVDRSASTIEVERLRSEVLRLRRAGYYLMKCLEAWDPSFKLDADEIYGTLYHRSSRKKTGEGPKTKASGESPDPGPKPQPPENSGGPSSAPEEEDDPGPDDDLVSLAELEALHTALHGEQPDEADGS